MSLSAPSQYYSIHDIVIIQSNTEVPIPDFFRVPESEIDSDPDISIIEGDVETPVEKEEMTRCQLFFFAQTDDTFVIDYMFPVIDAKLLLQDLGDRTRISFTEPFRKFGDLDVLIKTILQFKLIQTGHTIVHAGAIQRNDDCSLIAGMRDTGKTSTVLSAVDGKETTYLSDDLSILAPDGTVYNYPTEVGISPFTLTGDLLSYDGGELKRFAASHQLLSFPIQNVLGIELSERKHVPEWAITESGQLESIFVLGGSGGTDIKPISEEVAARKLIMTTAELLDPFRIYSLNFYAFYLDFDVAELFSEQRRIVESALSETDCYEMRANDIGAYATFVDDYA